MSFLILFLEPLSESDCLFFVKEARFECLKSAFNATSK